MELQQLYDEHREPYRLGDELVEADPAGYLAGTRRLLERTKARGDWEEAEFLPAAARCLARGATLRKAG